MKAHGYRHIDFALDDHVAVATLLNGRITRSVHSEICELLSDVAANPAVRSLVMTGQGNVFALGGDPREAVEQIARPPADRLDDALSLLAEMRAIAYGIVNLDVPVVAAVNGDAMGAGLSLALLSDISVVAEDAVLCESHVPRGLVAGDHAAMIWPLLCGMAKTKYYLLTGEKLSGRKAEQIGLVSEALPANQVLERALSIGRQLAEAPRHAVSLTKRALNQWLRQGGLSAFDYSAALEMLTFYSADAVAAAHSLASDEAPQSESGKTPSSSSRGGSRD